MVDSFFSDINEEVIVFRSVFDDKGFKDYARTQRDMGNGQKVVSKWVRAGVEEWKKMESVVMRNKAHYDKLAAAVNQVITRANRLQKIRIKRQHQSITDMGRADIVRGPKGNLLEGTRITTLSKDLNQFTSRIVSSEASIKQIKGGLEEITTKYKNFEGNIVKTTKEIKKQRQEFSMWALSFVFAGMQIKAVSEQITRASVGTYLRITEGNTEASRSLIGLAAHFKFLQFEVGQAIGRALAPLLPILIRIISGAAQFVQLHPEATFIAIAGAFVLGGGMFLGGQMVLFADALTSLAGKMGGFSAAKGMFGFLANPAVAATIAALIVLGGLTWVAFNKTPAAWNSATKAMSTLTEEGGSLDILKTSLEDLLQSVFPRFSLNWESIAWTAAWAFDIIVSGVKQQINVFSLLVNAIMVVVNAIGILSQAWNPLFWTDYSKKQRDNMFTSVKNGIANIKTTVSSMGSVGVDGFTTLTGGVEGYKNKMLKEELSSSSQSGPNYTPVPTYSQAPRPIFNANTIIYNGSKSAMEPEIFPISRYVQ